MTTSNLTPAPAQRPAARSQTRDLTQGPIASTLIGFALPILAGNVLQSLNGSINAIWVGRYLGEAALAAVANANNLMFLMIGLVFGIGMAATILVAQAMGAKDMARAKAVIGSSASFFTAVSVLIALLGFVFARRILQFMGTPPDVLVLAQSYLQIIFVAIPLLYLFAFLQAVLRGAGDARTPFIFLTLVVLLDVVLNPLLIFGWGPVPAMGMRGSALALLLANGVSLAALLAWLRHKRHPLWLGRADVHLLVPQPAILRTLITKGLPMGLQIVLVSLSMLALLRMVNGHGTQVASAYSAALQLWTYVQMPAMAIGAACSTMAAQNVGAKRWDRVEGTAHAGVWANLLMTGALAALIVWGERWVLGLFLPPGSAAIPLAVHLNTIAIWSFVAFGVTFVLSGVVRSTGAVMPPLIILAATLWGIRVPAANYLQGWIGLDGIWWSFPLSAVVAMCATLAYYRWGNWRKSHMGPTVPEETVTTPAEVMGEPPSPIGAPLQRPLPEPELDETDAQARSANGSDTRPIP